MITINLGMTSSGSLNATSAYGILRSSFLPIDALFLAVQGVALGTLFGMPRLGASCGALVSITDRLFSPFINMILPGQSHTLMGFPLGIKNIALAALSIFSSLAILKRI